VATFLYKNFMVKQYWIAKGSVWANIAAATTTDLATATGNSLSITGNTAITSFWTVDAGTIFVLEFTGTPVITYHATSLKLPGAANITATAWDVMTIKSLWSWNWKCIWYERVNGMSIVAPVSMWVVVDPTAWVGNYTTLKAAIEAGNEVIQVNAWTYIETPMTVVAGKNLSIHCKSWVTFNCACWATQYLITASSGGKIKIYWWVWNITFSNTDFNWIRLSWTSLFLSDIDSVDINAINDTNSAYFYTQYDANTQWTHLTTVRNSRFTATLWLATAWCRFKWAPYFEKFTYISCSFIARVSSAQVSIQDGWNFLYHCDFDCWGNWTVRNSLIVNNCSNCTGRFSRALNISNCIDCSFGGSNQTSDSAYDYWTWTFRMTASNCSWCYLESGYQTGNWLLVNSGTWDFIWNTVSWWEYNQFWNGDTNYNLKFVVSWNHFSQAFAQSSVVSKTTIKQAYTQYCNNTHTWNFNYSPSGSTVWLFVITADSKYSMVCNNIIKSDSTVLPTITDSSTGTVKTNNLITIS